MAFLSPSDCGVRSCWLCKISLGSLMRLCLALKIRRDTAERLGHTGLLVTLDRPLSLDDDVRVRGLEGGCSRTSPCPPWVLCAQGAV